MKRQGIQSRSKIQNGFLLLFLSFLFLYVASSLQADFNKRSWRFFKKITWNNQAQKESPGLLKIRLDAEVYDKSLPSLDDLRIISRSGQEIPYVFYTQKDSSQEIPRDVKRFNEGSDIPGRFETVSLAILDLKEGQDFYNRLILITSGKNFKRRVEVEGSLDQKEWLQIKNNGYLLNFSEEGVEYRKNDIFFPPSHYPYLRLKVFHNFSEKAPAFKIEDVFLYKTVSHKAQKMEIPVHELTLKTEPRLKETHWVVDLHYRNLPHEQIILQKIPDKNFYRRCAVEIGNDLIHWSSVGSSLIYNFSIEGYQDSHDTVSYPESRSRYIRLRVYNGDSPPLHLYRISVYGLPRDVVFENTMEKEYFLFYGNPEAQGPVYDLATVSAHMDKSHAVPMNLNPGEGNPDFKEKEKPLTERNPYLLWVLFGGLFLLLAWMIGRTLWQVQRS